MPWDRGKSRWRSRSRSRNRRNVSTADFIRINKHICESAKRGRRNLEEALYAIMRRKETLNLINVSTILLSSAKVRAQIKLVVLNHLTLQVSLAPEVMGAQGLRTALYGLRGLSDSAEVRALLAALTPKVQQCKERLDDQQLRFAKLGLRSLQDHSLAGQLQAALAQITNHDLPVPLPTSMGPQTDNCPFRLGSHVFDVHHIWFSQETCSHHFRHGTIVLETAAAIIKDPPLRDKIPQIQVVWHKGKLFSLDNRRLAAFRIADLAVKHRQLLPLRITVRLVSGDGAMERRWSQKFMTGLWAGKIIRITGRCGGTAGTTLASTTYGRELVESAR